MTAPVPPPGWYPDPNGGPSQRYWDGKAWTAVPPPPAAAPTRSSWSPLKVLAIIAIVAFFLVGGCAVACISSIGHDLSSSISSSSTTTSAVEPAPTVPGLNQEARDGKFGFTVRGVGSLRTVTGRGEDKTAQGIYVVLTIDVTNTGDRSQGYYGDNQKLIDSDGRQFSSDSLADIVMNGDLDGTDINPGNHISVQVAFDVPVGTQPAQVVLHDSAFSGGVKVNLN